MTKTQDPPKSKRGSDGKVQETPPPGRSSRSNRGHSNQDEHVRSGRIGRGSDSSD
jgi:hypothetical protein